MNMNKKQYQKPSVECIEVHVGCQIMAGSNEFGSSGTRNSYQEVTGENNGANTTQTWDD